MKDYIEENQYIQESYPKDVVKLDKLPEYVTKTSTKYLHDNHFVRKNTACRVIIDDDEYSDDGSYDGTLHVVKRAKSLTNMIDFITNWNFVDIEKSDNVQVDWFTVEWGKEDIEEIRRFCR